MHASEISTPHLARAGRQAAASMCTRSRSCGVRLKSRPPRRATQAPTLPTATRARLSWPLYREGSLSTRQVRCEGDEDHLRGFVAGSSCSDTCTHARDGRCSESSCNLLRDCDHIQVNPHFSREMARWRAWGFEQSHAARGLSGSWAARHGLQASLASAQCGAPVHACQVSAGDGLHGLRQSIDQPGGHRGAAAGGHRGAAG